MNNREIKFRYYDSVTKSFVYSDEFCFSDPLQRCVVFFQKAVLYANGNIQQYTGLKDSAGREIYEGDILQEYIANETRTSIGICKQVLGGWKIFSHPSSSIYWHGWKQTIIGNIFENPELLK
jgi:uncharacterized phage protein (TIGR01671 family)